MLTNTNREPPPMTVDNSVVAATTGIVVQAGAVNGDVHLHPPALPKVFPVLLLGLIAIGFCSIAIGLLGWSASLISSSPPARTAARRTPPPS
ncbi:hypothetical protein SK571_26705 [Lentzea sp. BCCO 10_0798]|uniref:Uncharacterized protein n=1 Tax=Lentzea kristufekii TaxID=3095430 RepID=A0ABU4TXE8_9PSEU|nr:hypothetical protein [Lentzea sp. BCCO 10_0798]MDX8052983.1 hypothetical protein [Lentzea sp. BCCO 10_0798]